MISSLEHDSSTIKREFAASQAALSAELKLKNELLEKSHIKIAEILQSHKLMLERNQLLENNLQAVTAEFDEVRTKCQKMTLELEEAHKKREHAEGLNQELKTLLGAEQKRCQEAMLEISQVRQQSLERQELVSLINDMQERQMREKVELEVKLRDSEQSRLQLEEASKKKEATPSIEMATVNIDAEAKIQELQQGLKILQEQRNREREGRLKLKRRIDGRPRKVVKICEEIVTEARKKRCGRTMRKICKISAK
jgi:hypothetical protein